MQINNRHAGCNAVLPRQAGAVLVVSLIFLLVLTLIAVASTRDTVLQEKMAGNARDRNLAFQVAESGVREGEIYLQGIASMGNFSTNTGLYGLTDAEPAFTDAVTWSDPDKHIVANSSYGAYEAPRYYIKHFTTVTGTEGAMNMSGYGDNKGSGDVTVFSITARGTGGSADSAEVILRSRFGRIF